MSNTPDHIKAGYATSMEVFIAHNEKVICEGWDGRVWYAVTTSEEIENWKTEGVAFGFASHCILERLFTSEIIKKLPVDVKIFGVKCRVYFSDRPIFFIRVPSCFQMSKTSKKEE